MNETLSRNPLGYETQHNYDDPNALGDTDGDLTDSVLPDGSTLQYYGKNGFHKHCASKDPRGNYTLSRYDTRGNLTQTIVLKQGVSLTEAQLNDCDFTPSSDNILAWTINSYDTVGNLLTTKQVRDFTTGAGPYVEYVYDANNLNPTTVNRCGIQHDDNDNLVSHCLQGEQVFDDLGRATQRVNSSFYDEGYEYDLNGRLIRKTDSLGEWRNFTYDDNGNLLTSHLLGLGDDGKVEMRVYDVIEYDRLNRPVVQKNKSGHSSRTEYDEIGNVLKVTNPDGYSVSFEYDAMNRPLSAFDEHGHAVVTTYDIGGRPTTITDPNGLLTEYSYYGPEENGRLRLVTSPDGRTLQYFYDNNGNVIRTIDNLGRETLTEYDALNRPVRSVGPVHITMGLGSIRQVTVTEYNALGQVIK
jgi:YD repeat-containing protein